LFGGSESRYLTQDKWDILPDESPKQIDGRTWESVLASLNLFLTETKLDALLRLLSAVLYLGNIGEQSAHRIADETNFRSATRLLGVDNDTLAFQLTNKTSNFAGQVISKQLTSSEVVAGLKSFMIELYTTAVEVDDPYQRDD